MALKACLDCGDLTAGSRCPDCNSIRNKTRDLYRGSTAARGYGPAHQELRKRWAPAVALGEVICARCGIYILPGTPWDLGHSEDRTTYNGPEHAKCNRGAPHQGEQS